MKNSITNSTVDEQIEMLKAKGLIIDDVDFAKKCLSFYGYYNIINSYKEPYIETVDGCKRYKNGVSFEQIFSLFTLDHNLRNTIMAAMLDLEEHVKAAVADVLSESFGVSENDYLQWKNYRDRNARKKQFTLHDILETLQKNLNSDKDPIRYYREKKGTVPPWILLKGTYFGTLVNFVRLFKSNEKSLLFQKLYGLPASVACTPAASKLLTDTLFICQEYRNLAAHGGRVYNYRSSARFTVDKDTLFLLDHFDRPEMDPQELHGISQLLYLLLLYKYKDPFGTISATFDQEINRHLGMYPQDQIYFEAATGFYFTPHAVVWISSTSKKYHNHPNCSGMKNAIKLDLEQALADDYSPCKRCNPK